MRRFIRSETIALATLVIFEAACSGPSQTLPSAPIGSENVASHSSAAGVPSGYAVVRFRIEVPGRTKTSRPHRVFPAYVSTATQKVVATVRGANAPAPTSQTFRCVAVCEGKIVAPLGVDLVTLQLEDKRSRVLSRGSTTILVFKKSGNVFDLTLDGVPVTASIVPESNFLPVVPASSGWIVFEARDADGKIITPDGHFSDAAGNPLVFGIKSNNKALHLSVDTVSAPTAPIAFSYNGALHVGSIVVTPGARRGVHTSVAFHNATIRLVPGIASRISPPKALQVLTATQVPMPTGSTACGGLACEDPGDIFVLGNSGTQQIALTFNTATGAYALDSFNEGLGGPFAEPPVDSGGNGFSGFFLDGTNAYGDYVIDGASFAYGGSSNPCPAPYFVPIGGAGASFFCEAFGTPNVYDATASQVAAYGYERKIRMLDGTAYIATADVTTPQELYSYAGGVSTLVAGALGVGANVSSPATGYFGKSDGTVSLIGGSSLATFSRPVEDVVGLSSSLFVYENGGRFGVSVASGIYETAALPIGAVVDVVTGVNGAPMLVESDGTLDVMGI